ncbi:MAG: adenine nucleotide alpha hydrolase family protein [Desulfobacteraceae bacterium]|nr:adenine nucleotide alpha hydrolase family protein [Desulfobacteraceae bacterium]
MNTELPQLPPQAKCTRCRGRAVVSLPSHNSRFCEDCFIHFFQTAVKRGLKKAGPGENSPLMVAVSGGKDSLCAWSVLNDLGYETRGLHINLGIEGFSEASREAVAEFAASRGLSWSEYSLKNEFGYSMPEIYSILKYKICSVCGRLKRQFLNRLTAKESYSCVVTGHNLDDEAARLLGNLIGDRQEFVSRQFPWLPSPHPKIPAKLKPLHRLEIKEILAYCKIKHITPSRDACPFSRGATSNYFAEALEFLDKKMPGTKRGFLFSYLRKPKELRPADNYVNCAVCGEPALFSTCPVCGIKKRIQEIEAKRFAGQARKSATDAKGTEAFSPPDSNH